MDLVGFLDALYAPPRPPGAHITVWCRQTKLSKHFPVSAGIECWVPVLLHAADLVALGHDAYFGVGLRREGLQSGQRGGKSDVVAVPGLWIDIDIASPIGAHAAENLPDLPTACGLIERCGFDPTIVIHSGFGVHAYWCFSSALLVGPGEAGRIGAACKQLQQLIIDAAAEQGLHVDVTSNVDRVLRLPDTQNFKIPGNPQPTKVLIADGPRYDPRILIPGVVRQRQSAANAASAAAPSTTGAPAPLSEEHKQARLAETVSRLRRLSNHQNRKLMTEVLAGRPFAQPGVRDATLQKVVSIIAFTAPPRLDAEALVPLLVPSLVAMQAEADNENNPALTIDDALEKLGRALDEAAREREREERIRSALLKKPDTPSRPTEAVAGDDPAPAASTEAPQADRPRPTRTTKYTEEDLGRFAESQGTVPEKFLKRWIIQHASAYYSFIDGRYHDPVGREALLVHLRDDLALAEDVGVTLWTFAKDGGPRRKTPQEILDAYGTGARKLRGSLLLDESKFDLDAETFWEAMCPRRNIEPVFDVEIDAWLNLLGGAMASKLLDWIATVTDLDRQTSALYLSGRPNAGKTMLAAGLSRIWTPSGPTELVDVVDSSFNAGIARCPLIFGDEDMDCSTTDLRRLIGSSSHTLRRKYLPNIELEGALRVILADNSGKMLRDEEIGGGDDLDAVASKFLHVIVDDHPVEFLKGIGGRLGTMGWVDGDKIAAHALYLAKTRNVIAGSRFLVEGQHTSMTRMLAVQGRISGLVCEWIAGYLDKPIPNPAQEGTAIVGGGHVLINVDAIEKHWVSFIHSEKPFSRTRIGKALFNLSRGTKRVGTKRYHDVRPDLIYEWSESNLVGDLTAMKARVEAPLSPELAAAVAAST